MLNNKEQHGFSLPSVGCGERRSFGREEGCPSGHTGVLRMRTWSYRKVGKAASAHDGFQPR